MRKLQNIVSNFGLGLVRQGNQLVVRIESLRSLRASSYAALHSYASSLASSLGKDAWQGPTDTWQPSLRDGARTDTATGFAAAIKACVKQVAVVKPAKRRHLIMCHRTAA